MEYSDWLPDAMRSINLFESNVLHWSSQDCYNWAVGEATKMGLRLDATTLDSFLHYTGYDLAKFGLQDFCQKLSTTYGSFLYESFRELMRAEGLEVHIDNGCCATATTTTTHSNANANANFASTLNDNFDLEEFDVSLQALDMHLHGVDSARTPDHQDEVEDGQLDDLDLLPAFPADDVTEMLPAVSSAIYGMKEEERWPIDIYTVTNLPFLPSPSPSPSPYTHPKLSPKSEDDDGTPPPTPPRDEDSPDWLSYDTLGSFCDVPSSPPEHLTQPPPLSRHTAPRHRRSCHATPSTLPQEQAGPLAPLQTPSRKRRRGPKNWEFIARLLADPKHNPSLVQWMDKSKGTFKLNKPGEIASMWGHRSTKKDSLTYDNFARGLRYHYTTGALSPVHERQLVYRCGPKMIQFLKEEFNSRRSS